MTVAIEEIHNIEPLEFSIIDGANCLVISRAPRMCTSNTLINSESSKSRKGFLQFTPAL